MREHRAGGHLYFLTPGDEYDLHAREARRPARRTEPVPRVVKQPWKKPSS